MKIYALLLGILLAAGCTAHTNVSGPPASPSGSAVDGKWIAQVAGTMGQQDSEITLIFKTEGSKVTGTLNNTLAPGDVTIEEGKLEGDQISFSLKRNFGQSDMKIVWKGTVAGDEIKFTRGIEGGMGGPGGGGGASTEIIAKRAE